MRQRILIIEVNWIGDVIFSTPFIRALREAYPKSYIACLLHPRCLDVLEGSPRLDEIIVYDEEGVHGTFPGKVKLVMSLRKKRFDSAFILHRSFTKAFLAYAAGIRERIGYATKQRGALLTNVIEPDAHDIHKVEYFLKLARDAGISAEDGSYEFFIHESDRDFIRAFFARHGLREGVPLAVLCPGGNWDPKRWPKERFAELAGLLAEKHGMTIAIAGAAQDAKRAEEIAAMMKRAPLNLCGKTTLSRLGALFEKAHLVVANDTGPMHLAVAMHAPTIALFGPTSSRLTGPYGRGAYEVVSTNVDCDIPCYDFTCHDNRCMAAISVEDVLKKAEKLLQKS